MGVLDAGEETGGNGTFGDWIRRLLGAGCSGGLRVREWEVVARCRGGVRGRSGFEGMGWDGMGLVGVGCLGLEGGGWKGRGDFGMAKRGGIGCLGAIAGNGEEAGGWSGEEVRGVMGGVRGREVVGWEEGEWGLGG